MARLRWSKLVKVLALGAGGLAAVNAYLAATAPPLLPPVRAKTQHHLWRGFRLAYWVAGPEDAPPVVLIHGHYPFASAYEMRRPFSHLSERFRVYLLDLLGYGLSARPPLVYTAELYRSLIADFARQVVGRPIHGIASLLSAAHTIAAAAAEPELFRSLTLICPGGIGIWDGPPLGWQRTIGTLLRVPVFGEALFNALTCRPAIAYLLRNHVYAYPSLVTEGIIDLCYTAAHQPGARYAPSAFLSGQLNCDVRQDFARLELPVQLVWGRQAEFVPVTLAQSFLSLNGQARLDVLDDAGLTPHEEQAEMFNARVVEFITSVFSR
ncbi:MAG: alpha/beta fold hydrolase [Anaerolineae bacterium]|nr:alpha/beta fold hydrolase [Anaerolineae bacterium]MDW8100737.1 alpha/beta fold hydrolase [Anaerolineae bacterium]